MKGFGITDRGVARKENQDCFRLQIMDDTDSAVMVLCDGMGGAQAGSVASALAADAFLRHTVSCFQQPGGMLDPVQTIRNASDYANIKVYDRSFADFACMGMGTTLVGVIIRSGETFISNVGDSRAYILSGGAIEQVTQDHSLVEDLIRRGKLTRETAKNHPRRNVITRALGVEQSVICDIFQPKVDPGDVLLLCSDGLSNLVGEEEMTAVLAALPEPEPFCRTLLRLALERGAPDNVTAVALLR